MDKKVTLVLITPDNQKCPISLIIPINKVRLNDLLPQLHILFDKIIDIELFNKYISCKNGCGECCKQLIPLSIPEVFYIYELIVSLPSKRQNIIRDKFNRALDIPKRFWFAKNQVKALPMISKFSVNKDFSSFSYL